MDIGFLLIQYTVVANSSLSLRVITPFLKINFALHLYLAAGVVLEILWA